MAVLSSIFLLFLLPLLSEAALQNVTVKGQTICNKKLMGAVKIELYEKDLIANDLLNTTVTDTGAKYIGHRGLFEIYGQQSELGKIEPFLRITHQCGTKPFCNRTADFPVPTSALGGVYDMKHVTLDIKQQGETERCL